MQVGAVHMCLEYLINSTDVDPCLLAVGGIEGRRRAGKREWDKIVSAHRKSADEMKKKIKSGRKEATDIVELLEKKGVTKLEEN